MVIFLWIHLLHSVQSSIDNNLELQQKLQQPGSHQLLQELDDGSKFRDIDCRINKEYSITCKKDDADVYVPFSFLAKYFEVRVDVGVVPEMFLVLTIIPTFWSSTIFKKIQKHIHI